MPDSPGGSSAPSPDRSLEGLYADWLARRAVGDEREFEDLCRDHPEHADALRRMHSDVREVDAELLRAVAGGTLARRLAALFGDGVDPGVELESEGEGEGDFTARVLERLAEHAPRSGRYRLKGQVAEGGMGAILRVWDEDLRRHLAMKVVLGRRAAPSDRTPPVDRKQLARFLEEAQVTGQLDHPGIVPIHELGLDERGRAYFTMKLVKGRDLKAVFDLVRTGAEGWSQVKALGVLLKVCDAMSYAHDKRVIHRDLKPANVMVGRYGEVYVMDWGLARILGREDAKDVRLRAEPASSGPTVIQSDRREAVSDTPDSPLYTMDGDVVGTPAYMPPEQANGDLDALGPRSDVYAVGAMLYHLLAGHMPYVRPGEKASNYTVLRWVKDGPPHPLLTEAPGAPPELVAIADKAMARDPRRRYPDMAALARDLSAFLEERVVAAYETGAWAEGKKWVRRNRALASALAAAVLILVAGIATSLVYAREAKALALSEKDAKEAAERNEAEAERLRDEAVDRERELRVQGLIHDLAAFDAAGQSLDYALRQSEPAAVWWPRRARLLLEGQEEDLEGGIPWRPGLADAEAQLVELRSQALERTLEEMDADRAAFPRAKELSAMQAELAWHKRMQGEEPWPQEAEVETALSSESLPTSAAERIDLAWELVDPDSPDFGEEVRGLVLARLAVEAAEAERLAALAEPPATATTASQPVPEESTPVALATGSKDRDWSAWQAVGPPDAVPLNDDPQAWTYARRGDAGPEWLELGYDPPLRCARIRILEVNAAGGVFRVTALDVGGQVATLWEGEHSASHPGVFEIEIEPTERPLASVKLHVDPKRSDTWLEIDAVQVSGPDGSGWASTARASSEYGADGAEEEGAEPADPEAARARLSRALDVQAWALLRTGRLEQALETGRRAAREAPLEDRSQREESLRGLEDAAAERSDGRAAARVERLVAEVALLEEERDERRTWRFEQSDLEWWHGELAALIEELHRLAERLAFVERSVEGPEAVALWNEAIAAIEVHPRYGGLKLTPQIGLLPIGPDPVSGLWEFAHLQTGERAQRVDGKLVLTEETGLVFVLLPGGRFHMGAQKRDPEGRNYDPSAQPGESPVHEVELSPFFLSKYEMAQGPWRRIASWSSPYWGTESLSPASSVSWDDCVAALQCADAWITLCTEAQWEYACRAGTETPWWTGSEAESLRGKENVSMENESRGLLPIGRLAANRFGLHEMHGNLWEWCLDGYGGRYTSDQQKDPLHSWEGAGERVIRGGNHWYEPVFARSSSRFGSAPDYRDDGYGLRPARRIAP